MMERIALTEKEAAHYLNVGVGTLQKSRSTGNLSNRMSSPPFVKIGRAIRYLKGDLDRWLQKHRRSNHILDKF